jgi:hypothetical protein
LNEIANQLGENPDIEIIIKMYSLYLEFSDEIELGNMLIVLDFVLQNCLTEPDKYTENINKFLDLKFKLSKDNKTKFAKVLYNAFSETASESIKKVTLVIVREQRLKMQFKPLISEEEQTFYEKNIKSGEQNEQRNSLYFNKPMP